MGIFINNQNRREDYDQIAQLQNQINSYLANPNVDESAKSSARKQLEELSANVSTYGSRKEARKFAISTLNSIASSLKTSEDYTPEYVTPSAGLPYIETFKPEMVSNRYNVAGVKPDLNKTVREFSDFLAQQLTHAQGVLSDNSKVLYGWNKANTNQIQTWLTELAKQPATDQAAKEKISYIGNVIVNALANEGLAQAFENKFAPWLEGSDEYKAAQAAAAVEAQKAAKNPKDLAAYPTLTSKGYIFEKGSDGKYIAYKVKEDGTKGDAVNQEDGYMNPDFTSNGYKSGWIIGPNGVVTLINDFSDVTTYRDYLQTEGWKQAIKNAKDALEKKYPKAFNFTNTFNQNPFGEGIAHGNKNFVDLSYYFPGVGYVLGVQKDTDVKNFEGYNWNEEDREFYVSKDGQNWEIVKGMAAVRTLLGLNEGAGFKYEGADILADPDIDNRSQFNRNRYLEKPDDWDRVPTFSSTVGSNYSSYGYDSEQQLITDLVTFINPEKFEEFGKKEGSAKVDKLRQFKDVLSKNNNEKTFYKWLFLKAQALGLPEHELGAILFRFMYPDIPLEWTRKQIEDYLDSPTQHKQGGVLKLSTGGTPFYMKYVSGSESKPKIEETEIEGDDESETSFADLYARAEANGRSVEGQEKGETEFTGTAKQSLSKVLDDPAMQWRLGALAADVLGLVSSFVPGYGTAAAGVLGAASFAADLKANSLDKSMTQKEKWINGLTNLGLGVVGLIPGGKAWKIIKSLAIYGPTLVGLGMMGPESLSKIKKANDGSYNLTYDDWKEIAASVSMIAGLSSNAVSGVKMRMLKYKPDETIKGYTIKDISTKKEYDLTPAEVERIAQIGETKGQKAAIKEIKSILKKKSKYANQADEINKSNFDIEYGSPLGKERTKIGWWGSKHFLNRTTIQDAATPVYNGQPNPISAYYADNPYRGGNPYKQWDESAQNTWSLLASDYALANGIRTSLIGFPTKLKFDFLKSLKNIGKGPGYYSKNLKTVELEIGDIKIKRNIPKDHELIKVKNGDQEQVVEIAPLKNNNNETILNEYVNVKDKNEVYTKTADGKFEKKNLSQTQTPNQPTNQPNPSLQPDLGTEYTTTQINFIGKNKYKKAAAEAKNKGITLMSKEEVNNLLIKQGKQPTAKTGGFIINGKLTYNRSGGKLNRLNNYLNNN